MAKKLTTRLEALEEKITPPEALPPVSEGVLCLDAYAQRLVADDDFFAEETERVANYLLENQPQMVSVDECCDEALLLVRVAEQARVVIESELISGVGSAMWEAAQKGPLYASPELVGTRPGIDYMPAPGILIGILLAVTLDDETKRRIAVPSSAYRGLSALGLE